MEIQTSVAPSEIWLKDDLENIYAVLFRFLGYGFWLVVSNVGWLATPSSSRRGRLLLDRGEPCDICQHSSYLATLCVGFFVDEHRRHWAHGIPTDQLSCTTTATVTLSLRACMCFLLSHLLSQVHRRPKQLSDFVEPKKYWRAKRGSLRTRRWISQDSHVPWSSRGGTRVSSGLIARQMEEPEEPKEQGKKSRAGRGSVCNLARQAHRFGLICWFFDPPL